MLIKYEQLSPTLKKNLASIYLVHGEEPLLIQDCRDKIRQAAFSQGFVQHFKLFVETDSDWQNFQLNNNHYSIFTDNQIFEIILDSAKIGKIGSDALCSYINNYPSNQILLISIPEKLPPNIQKSSWFKAIDQAGVIIQIWRMFKNQLPKWIQQELAKFNLQADSATINLIAEYTEGNLLMAARTVEHLSLLYPQSVSRCGEAHAQTSSGVYIAVNEQRGERATKPQLEKRRGYPQSKLSFEQVKQAIQDNSQFSLYDLADQILEGNCAKTVKIMRTLQLTKLEPILVLWILAKELRGLINLLSLVKPGFPIEQAMFQAKIWEQRKPLIKAVLARQSLSSLQRLLQQCAQLDYILKNSSKINHWHELEKIAYQLASTTISTDKKIL